MSRCYACHKTYASRNDLFRHLSLTPLHKCKVQWVSYTLRCAKHPNINWRWPYITTTHHICKTDEHGYPDIIATCDGIRVHSVQIRSRGQPEYTITDFDQQDFVGDERESGPDFDYDSDY